MVHQGRETEIWQAYHDGEHKRYALKIVSEADRKNRKHLALIRREFDIASEIRHPRIIKMMEMDQHKGRLFIAMEWFPAPNMKKLISLGYEKIAPQVQQILIQAAEGLAHFNSLGWVHCDVKPENFLVSEEAEVKMVDMAIARRSKSGLSKMFSLKSKIQGTPTYMSPEQIRGKALDVRSDVYSFACMSYEAISGRRPFSGMSQNEVLQRHLNSEPPSLSAANNNVTPQITQLICAAMAKDPAARPPTMEDFLIELRRHKIFKVQPRAEE